MSLKMMGLSIVIGSVFAGAKAISDSTFAVAKLQGTIEKLGSKKATLQADTKEYKQAQNQIAMLGDAITKINARKIKIDTIVEDREKFKSSLMEKLAIGTAIAVPIKVAIDFESSLVGIQKVVEFNNEAEFKKMGDDILAMSTRLPVAASGLSQIAASMGGIGIAKKDILGATEAVAIMSTAFDMSAESAGDSMGKLMNVYGLSVKEVLAVGDTINAVDAGTAAKAKLTVEVLGRIGGTAKAMGLSAHSAAGLAGAFLDLGVAPEVAGTGINALLSKMMTADKQNGKFQDGLKAIGMSATSMKNAVAKDATGAINGLINSLAHLPKSEQMGVLVDMFGTEYADDIALVVGGVDRYNKAMGIAADTTKNAGSMQEEFDKQTRTTANQLELLKNGVSVVAINMGSVLLPALNSVVGVLKPIASGFATLINIPILGDGIKIVLGLAAGFALTSIAIGGVGFVMGYAVTGFLALRNALTIAAVGVRILSGALMANPIGLIVTAIAVGATLIYANWQTISGFFASLWGGITSLFNSGLAAIKSVFTFNPLGVIVGAWGGVFDWFAAKFNFVLSGINNIASMGSSVASFFGFGGDDKKQQPEKKPQPTSTLGSSLRKKTVALATAGTLAVATPATTPKVVIPPKVGNVVTAPKVVIPPKVGNVVTAPKVGNAYKEQISNSSKNINNTSNTANTHKKSEAINIVVNINNPKITSKEEIQKMQIDVRKAVEVAMKELNMSNKNRTLKDVS